MSTHRISTFWKCGYVSPCTNSSEISKFHVIKISHASEDDIMFTYGLSLSKGLSKEGVKFACVCVT